MGGNQGPNPPSDKTPKPLKNPDSSVDSDKKGVNTVY